MLIHKNDTVLFIGDSVTDAARDKENPLCLGNGYAMMAASWFCALYPKMDITFYNRGIKGHTVIDLDARWQTDCLDLNPNVLSILVGINDCIRGFAEKTNLSTEEYKAGYRKILMSAKEQNPDIKIIMMEPFSLAFNEGEHILWRENLAFKIAAMRELAGEFADVLIPLDGIFQAVRVQKTPTFWLKDGIHPTSTGHALIAQYWLKAIGAIS